MSNQFLEQIVVGAKVDTKGFKQADTALSKLNKNVKSVAATLGLAFGGAAVIQFGKQSVTAFINSERQAAVLTNTIKNLGLAFDQPAIDAYINKIGRLYGITGSQAVPAMQALLTATGSAKISQDIFNTALDVSSGLVLDVTDVAKALAQAYLGNTKALKQYNTGLTAAELAASDFATIQNKLNKVFAGSAKDSAKTYAVQLNILTEAGNRAQEVLGKGIIDSLMILSGDTTVEDLADTMLTAAQNAAELSVNLSKVIKTLNTPLDLASKGLAWFITQTQPLANLIFEGDPSGFMSQPIPKLAPNKNPLGTFVLKTPEMIKQDQLRAKAEKDAIARAKALAKLIKNQELLQAKILKDKQLSAAIDKANLALGKGTDVFDIEKIQLQAAEINQAQQLGKVTSQAQLLQITNDLARLQLKKDIIALDEAIASGDIKAIEAATTKLNKDLSILGALNNQSLKLAEIKSILEEIAPKDLINIANLKEAIDLLGKISLPSLGASAIAALSPAEVDAILANEPSSVATKLTPAQISGQRYAAQGQAQMDAYLAQVAAGLGGMAGSSFAQGTAAGLPVSQALSGARYAAQGAAAAGISVTVNAGIGDPNAIAETVTKVIQDAIDRGTVRNLAVQ